MPLPHCCRRPRLAGRKPRLGFEGGQTPLRLRVPLRGFHNPHGRWYRCVGAYGHVRQGHARDAAHMPCAVGMQLTRHLGCLSASHGCRPMAGLCYFILQHKVIGC